MCQYHKITDFQVDQTVTISNILFWESTFMSVHPIKIYDILVLVSYASYRFKVAHNSINATNLTVCIYGIETGRRMHEYIELAITILFIFFFSGIDPTDGSKWVCFLSIQPLLAHDDIM